MELKWVDGDYVSDGVGGLERVSGAEELLQRIRYRLRARRGGFPFAPTLGSELHLLSREKPGARRAAAQKYVAEALADEAGVTVTNVTLAQDAETPRLHLELTYHDEAAELTLALEGE